MDIAHDGDGGRNVNDIALAHQQLFCFGAYGLDHRICEQLPVIETLDTLVQVNALCKAIHPAVSTDSLSRSSLFSD